MIFVAGAFQLKGYQLKRKKAFVMIGFIFLVCFLNRGLVDAGEGFVNIADVYAGLAPDIRLFFRRLFFSGSLPAC